MGKASGAHHAGSANLFVALVTIASENAPVITEELGGTFPRPAHAKVEDNRSAGPAVLELVALVVATLGLVTLHADRGFVGLDVLALEQIAFKDGRHGKQQIAHGHDGRVERLRESSISQSLCRSAACR